jgi:thiol:disulfide interchange protein DsbA
MKKMTLHLLAWALCALTATVAQAAPGDPREGIDYVRVSPPQAQPQPGVEVTEFFSYGCPHCNSAEPLLAKWRATLAKDVRFKRVPISFGRPQWAALAKLYLALESTGDLAKMDSAVFGAIHVQNLPLPDEKAIVEWAAPKTADAKKFTDMYKSFDVQTRATRADQTGAAYKITGVPAIAVAGRYMVVATQAKNFEELLQVTSRVIDMARRETQGAGK